MSKYIFIVIILVILVVGITIFHYISTITGREEYREKRICIYAGSGAVFVKEVEDVLEKLKLKYYLVDEDFIREDKLMKYCTILIIPGGYTSIYVSSLGEKGFENIRRFIANGGGYIGICAGAYIASKVVEVPGRPEGLNIINITNVRRSGKSLVEITIVDLDHPIARNCSRVMKIWYQNGPFIIPGEDVEVIAKYNEKYAAIVCSKYGKGIVIVFSPHPEMDSEKLGTITLLKNSIKYILGNM